MIDKRVEVFLKLGNAIWDTKIGIDELDMYSPHKQTRASWVSDVEKRVGKLRFHPAWGRACYSSKLPLKGVWGQL